MSEKKCSWQINGYDDIPAFFRKGVEELKNSGEITSMTEFLKRRVLEIIDSKGIDPKTFSKDNYHLYFDKKEIL